MKFKLTPLLLSLAMLGAAALPALAADLEREPRETSSGPLAAQGRETDGTYRCTIEVNGETVDAAVCVMVPLRAVAEPLGFAVTWDDGSVLVDNGTIHTRVTIGVDQYVITTSRTDLVGMSAPFSLGAAPYVTDGVTYVPLGLFSALLGNREGAVALDGDRIVIQSDPVERANPFVACGTVAEAEQIAGFALELPPQLSAWAGQTEIRAVDSALIEVTYRAGDQELTVRKAPGSGDISGDYTVCNSREITSADGCRITVRETDGNASAAVWTRDGYAYAVSAAPGLEFEELAALAAAIR